MSERLENSSFTKKSNDISTKQINVETNTTNTLNDQNNKVKYYINPNFKGPLPPNLVQGQILPNVILYNFNINFRLI